ncbi:PaaI family thioesterase [Spongiivirga citrea]|uniref:Hotdog fold thioesterase n=1 Tax=Spongiivirga citrea TaxID=1481457 RepID=A0A6M0CR97_9FLAO|nr:PaaI family thioesterase [Spongiivirga citrea]NER16470.1 hotdog fold thioesterase [Spongiivirga citrea]
METLEITYTDVGDNFMTASMPVTSKVHQPDGVLNGGATVALAESLGGAASHVFVDTSKYLVRGVEIAANHLKSVRSGHVHAKAVLLHKGRTLQLWDIKVTDDEGNLISVVKLTNILLPKS